MRQFKARREPRSGTKTFFEHGRDEYLAAKVVPWVEPRRFCNALEEIYSSLGPLYKRSGYPWISLVLGSGCAFRASDLPDSFPAKDELYPEAQDWINAGDSVVVAPGGKIVAGPMRNASDG